MLYVVPSYEASLHFGVDQFLCAKKCINSCLTNFIIYNIVNKIKNARQVAISLVISDKSTFLNGFLKTSSVHMQVSIEILVNF